MSERNLVCRANRLLLLKCYDNKKVKSPHNWVISPLNQPEVANHHHHHQQQQQQQREWHSLEVVISCLIRYTATEWSIIGISIELTSCSALLLGDGIGSLGTGWGSSKLLIKIKQEWLRTGVLNILTRVLLLHTPKAGQNLHFCMFSLTKALI